MKKLLTLALALGFLLLCGTQIAANETETFASDSARLLCKHEMSFYTLGDIVRYEQFNYEYHTTYREVNYYCTNCGYSWTEIEENIASHNYLPGDYITPHQRKYICSNCGQEKIVDLK